jgi:hypothetical protein
MQCAITSFLWYDKLWTFYKKKSQIKQIILFNPLTIDVLLTHEIQIDNVEIRKNTKHSENIW